MSVYTASSTRAGNTGNITDAQSLAAKGGFGVFAYQTGGTDYTAGQTTFPPDFMYNQKVTGTDVAAPVWSYSPIKYWPNDNTAADNAGAKGETNTGKVSFFAYAPYAAVTNFPQVYLPKVLSLVSLLFQRIVIPVTRPSLINSLLTALPTLTCCGYCRSK